MMNRPILNTAMCKLLWLYLSLRAGIHGKKSWRPHACAAEIIFMHGHAWSVLGEPTASFAPNIPQEHRDYTNLYKLITAGSPHLHHCIYVPRVAGRRDPDASLDSDSH